MVYWDAEAWYWVAECDEKGYRYVPTRNAWPPPLVCVRCRTSWDLVMPPAAIVDGMTMRPFQPGDVCSVCGERIHRPIDPP